MERRGFIEFVGGIGFGTLIGYFVGAKQLLGIQSSESDSSSSPGTAAETTPENEATDKNSTPEQETETPSGQEVLFVDEFTDGTWDNDWEIWSGDPENITEEDGNLSISTGDTLTSDAQFSANGRIRVTTRMRTEEQLEDPSGVGFSLMFVNDQRTGNVGLAEDMHSGDASDDPEVDIAFKVHKGVPGSNNPDFGLGDVSDTTESKTYSLTVDLTEKRVVRARRGSETYDVDFDISDIYGESVQLYLGNGSNRHVRYEEVRLTRL